MKNSLDYIKNNSHKPIKKFGQNFLIDKNIIKKIVNAQKIDKNTCVIEIGPGLGALTLELSKKAGYLLAYEIDKNLVSLLRDNFKNIKNIKIKQKDFMKINLNKKTNELKKEFNKIVVVSNLPYYLSSQMIVKVLQSNKIDNAIFMMQKEFGQRLSAKISTKKYNNFTILVNYYSNIKKLFVVPPTVFIPKPAVESVVFEFQIKKNRNKINNEEKFFKFLKEIFSQKRKTILNNLSNVLNNKTIATKILENLNIDKKLRPENLNIDEFINIYNQT